MNDKPITISPLAEQTCKRVLPDGRRHLKLDDQNPCFSCATIQRALDAATLFGYSESTHEKFGGEHVKVRDIYGHQAALPEDE